MKKHIITLSLLVFAGIALSLVQCTSPKNQNIDSAPVSGQLPRVLIVTTGISEQSAKLAPGIVVAMQSLNKAGAIVRLEPRDILFKKAELNQYSVIILSTYEGYHDADRKYSLSYLSDEEIRNLSGFVAAGGVLIAGDNVGRNYPDGTDRISVFQKLTPANWGLSDCFGITFSERNVSGSMIRGRIPGSFSWETSYEVLGAEREELWALTPDSLISSKVTVLAQWRDGRDSAMALTENEYGKGLAYFMGYSAYLQPENDKGYWSADQIERFYGYVIERYRRLHGIAISLNPWPGAYDYAFCVSFNAEGNLTEYGRVMDFLRTEKLEPLVFVNGLLDKPIRDYLLSQKIPMASSGYAYSDFRSLSYAQAVSDILLNEDYWQREFSGFRFPYTRPGYWGLLALEEQGYDFESSIGANNIEFFHGSVVPHNLVMSGGGFYKKSDILEISPCYHDDYFFFDMISKDGAAIDSVQLERQVKVYGQYLENYWQRAVKPYKGLMVFLGHPGYTGYSDLTMNALSGLVKTVKADNTWITSVQEVVDFRKKLSQMQFLTEGTKQALRIVVKAPAGLTVPGVCLNYQGKIKSARAAKGKIEILEDKGMTHLIFEASDQQEIICDF